MLTGTLYVQITTLFLISQFQQSEAASNFPYETKHIHSTQTRITPLINSADAMLRFRQQAQLTSARFYTSCIVFVWWILFVIQFSLQSSSEITASRDLPLVSAQHDEINIASSARVKSNYRRTIDSRSSSSCRVIHRECLNLNKLLSPKMTQWIALITMTAEK